MTVFLISVLIFASVIIGYWVKFGIQPSISATYKLLKESKHYADEIWLLMLTFLGIGLNFLSLDLFNVVSVAGLTIVGCKPEYWHKEEGQKHVFGAYLGYLPLVARLFFINSLWFVVGCILVVLVLCVTVQFKWKGEKRTLIHIKNRTAIIEIVLFVVPVLSMILNQVK